MPIDQNARDHAVASLTTYAVANRADVTWNGQDAYDFLERVIVDFTDRLDNSEDGWAGIVEDEGYGPDHDDFTDFVHELADSAVPIYNGEIAGAWAGLQGWAYDEEVAEYGPCHDTLQMLRTGLYVIAEQLLYACREIAVEAINEYVDGAANDAALTR